MLSRLSVRVTPEGRLHRLNSLPTSMDATPLLETEAILGYSPAGPAVCPRRGPAAAAVRPRRGQTKPALPRRRRRWGGLEPFGFRTADPRPGSRRGAVVTPAAAVFLRESLWPGGRSARSSRPRALPRPLAPPPTRPLRPVIARNTRPLRLTATAGTKLVGAYFFGGISIPADVRRGGSPGGAADWFTTRRPSSYLTHEAGWIKLAPIVQNSCLLRPKAPKLVPTSVWRCVLSNPLGIHRFGGPLPAPTA